MPILVVRLYKGENFPSSGSVVVIGHWGTEEAESHVVSTTGGSPRFSCDLAFNIYINDERLSSNSPVMINCYSVDKKNEKQKLGSILLDTSRLTRQCKRYEFQNGDASSSRAPSVFLSGFMEDDYSAEHIHRETGQNEETTTSNLNPVVVDGKYIQIGDPVDEEFRHYTFSVTVMSIDNFYRIFPLKKFLPPPETEFNLSFYMFGQPVSFRTFTDPNDKDSIRQQATAEVFTSPTNLLKFLIDKMPSMTLLLCCNSYAVAEAIIPIGNKIAEDRLEKHLLEKIQLEPLILSGTYELTHLFKTDSSLSPQQREDSRRSVVDVIISIGAQVHPQSEKKTNSIGSLKQNTSPQISNHFSRSPSIETEKKELLYSVALELEVWKEEQKKIIEQQMLDNQKKQLEMLNQEYVKEVAKRDSILKDKLKKCEELEKHLEKAITTTQLREQHFNRLQANVQKEVAKLREEHAKALEKIQLEQRRQRELDKRSHSIIVNELKRKVQDLEAQLKAASNNS